MLFDKFHTIFSDCPSCTVPLTFSEIVLEVLAISWYTKRNGGDFYGKTKNISYNFNG